MVGLFQLTERQPEFITLTKDNTIGVGNHPLIITLTFRYIMTRNAFDYLSNNIAEFVGREVEYTYFIPSCDKYTTATGFIGGIGTNANSESLIINERGRKHAIHFTNVDIKNN